MQKRFNMGNYNDDSLVDDHSNYGKNDPLEEKWIVAFISSDTINKVFYRQFFAMGFYEAYDLIMTFVEKTGYQILWYKEKRKCDSYYAKIHIPYLEYICTFCNKKFNNTEPLKCNFENKRICTSEFCSFECRNDHLYHVHIKQKLN